MVARPGETPRVLVGTSAGAINAVLVAAALQAGDDACAAGLDVWGGIGRASVFEPLLPTSLRSGLRYALGLAGAGTRLDALLDVTPLRHTIERFEGWGRLHEAVAGGRLDAVAVLATATTQGRAALRTDVFVEAAARAAGGGLPPDDEARGPLPREHPHARPRARVRGHPGGVPARAHHRRARRRRAGTWTAASG